MPNFQGIIGQKYKVHLVEANDPSEVLYIGKYVTTDNRNVHWFDVEREGSIETERIPDSDVGEVYTIVKHTAGGRRSRGSHHSRRGSRCSRHRRANRRQTRSRK